MLDKKNRQRKHMSNAHNLLTLKNIVQLPIVLVLFLFRLTHFIITFIISCIKEHNAEKELESKIETDLRENVTSYSEYCERAQHLDQLHGMDIWKRDSESLSYDYEQIENRLFQLKSFLSRDDKDNIAEMLMLIRSLSHRNICGITNPQLFQSAIGTKQLIEEFIDEYCNVLKKIAATDYSECKNPVSELEKFQFFKESSIAIGKTALMLSGGASLGMYHLGVVKALYEQGLLPRIISGSSAGAIVAAVVCSLPDHEIPNIFQRNYFNMNAFANLDQRKSPIRKFLRFLKSGVFMDSSRLENCLRENIGDITFAESYERSGRILNITVNSSKGFMMPSLLNYISAPNVVIWSAAVCSCAVPGVFSPGRLMAKDDMGNIVPYHPSGIKFSDGSFWADLPAARLSEMFHVNFTICSQVNPHVIPFISTQEHNGVLQFIKQTVLAEVKYRIMQLYQYGLVPKVFNWFENLVSQEYTGDVTILPAGPLTLEVLGKLLKNPSCEFIEQCTKVSERRTWPKISVVKSTCKIESTIDECLEQVQRNALAQLNNLDPAVSNAIKQHLKYLFRSVPLTRELEDKTL